MSRTLLALLAAGLLTTAGCGGDDSKTEPTAEEGADAAKAGAEAAKDGAKKLADARAKKPSKEPIPAPDDVAAAPADAQKTASGLAYKVLTAGTGTEHAAERDTVKVHYTGWTTDGKMFDSSVQRGREASFPLNRVIAGWTEGLQLMVVGEKTRFWIPEDLAYKGRPGKPAGMLVFDVELFEITVAPPPPKVPDDVAAVPADAEKTESGLAYKFITKSDKEGRMQPGPVSLVQVNYTGWTTDGKMFDSSVTRGRPAMFPLNRVIAGWTEGLQLMAEGDTARLWVPEAMAYKGMAGKPAGMLVFDVELLRVMPTPKGGGTPLDAQGKPMPKPEPPKVVPAMAPKPKTAAADGGGTQPTTK
ncbi:MAG: FKBP-type peptidyl-prolyl cis-trans isomerase [Deltaproteobacteria bacterium]|nr:FKBP-type peptidyl-prolyl cis-trans isomerase [Deltaproteobacteria bacterium]